jgi:hypothetical protein
MSKPIPDKAEVALEYPDKLYIGTFERSSRFDAHLDGTGISLSLYRTGDADVRRSIRMHFHYSLFADILQELSRTAAALPAEDVLHRDELCAAAQALHQALASGQAAPPPRTAGRTHARARKDERDLSEVLGRAAHRGPGRTP